MLFIISHNFADVTILVLQSYTILMEKLHTVLAGFKLQGFVVTFRELSDIGTISPMCQANCNNTFPVTLIGHKV